MRDKIINYTLGVSLLLLLVLLPTSCAKEDNVGEKASVTMTFFTRAESNTQVSGGDLLPNERMKTLRVIVARQLTGEVLYNVKYNSFDKDENGRLYKTITFSELTVEKEGENFDFYAIANEEGTGYDDWSNVTVSTLESRNLNNIDNLNRKTFLIPQTAKKTIKVIPGETDNANVQLQFVVSKVYLTIKNTSTEVFTVDNIQLTGINMTSTPLFSGTTLSDDDSGTLTLGSMTIPGSSSESVYAYFYENTGVKYKLSANNDQYYVDIAEAILPDNSISRSTELDISVVFSRDISVGNNIFVGIYNWNEYNIEVDAFE